MVVNQSVLRKVRSLNRRQMIRRCEDMAHYEKTRTRAWTAKINNRWYWGGYHKLPHKPEKLKHHALEQLELF